MNILFIIGNGFDLNLGLKTSYSDFYEYYQSIKSPSKSISKLKSEIDSDIKNWSDLEIALGKYTENLSSLNEFDEVFEDIGEKLSEYLTIQEEKFNPEDIDINKFHDNLCFPEKNLLKADADRIINFRNKTNSSQWNIRIITFNYTTTIERILDNKIKEVRINTKKVPIFLQSVEHIHGYTNDRMVMGVNDTSQIKNKTFKENLDIVEAMVKNNCNQVQKHTIEQVCKSHISNSNIIYIFGSSLGESDNMWWQQISRHLRNNIQLVIFDRAEEIPLRIGYKLGRIERNRKELFLSKSDLSEGEKKQANQKISVGINTNMFSLKK